MKILRSPEACPASFLFFTLWLLVAAGFPLLGCGAGDGGSGEASKAGGDDDTNAFGDDDADAGDDDADDDAADDDAGDDDEPPPEPEEDIDPGTAPRVCDRCVYVLNTEGDFVSRIDSQSLDVATIEVGNHPTVLRATDDCRTLITLNTAGNTVSLIDPANAEARDLPVRPGLNSLQTAPMGRYALAFHHFDGQEGGDTVGYGEVSIIDMDDETVTSLSIGFPPDKAVFTSDGLRAVLISETTVALLSLPDGDFSTLPTGIDVDAGQRVKKIGVTSDGHYALVLVEASKKILALDLSADTLSEVDLGCFPTDLEIASEGDVSLLVCKQQGKVIVLSNGDLHIRSYSTTETVGSGELTAAGDLAILFTNSEAIERVHIFHTVTGVMQTYLTVKPVKAAAIAPDDKAAILFHEGGDGQPIDAFDDQMDQEDAFSILTLSTALISPVVVPEIPETVTFGSDGLYSLIPMPNSRKVVLSNLRNGLTDEVTVPSTPMESGILAELKTAFVLQDHPLGRISFISTETLKVRTVTGFLLNAGIDER